MDCIFCGKKTRLYKTWKDWDNRSSHYRCWKKNEQDKALKQQMYDFIQEQKRIQAIKDELQETRYAQS